MGFVIGGAVLAIIGVVLLVTSRKRAAHATLMAVTETSTVGGLASLVDEVRADLPGGGPTGYAQLAELKGTLVADTPVVGELSGEAAAIVETRVEREIERRTERRDANGRTETRWEKSRETVSENRREAVFYLDDGTGRVRVLPAGASLELEKVVDRFEPPQAAEQGAPGSLTVGFGSFRVTVGGVFAGGADRRTLGYHFQERILPLGRPVYALGEVADGEDGLALRRPEDRSRPFLLSTRGEEELVRKASSAATWQRGVGLALIALGVVLALVGLLR